MAARRLPSARGRPGGLDGVSRESRVLRELVTIYHHLTGLALQNADLGSVTRLLADRTSARVAVLGPTLDVLAAAMPGRGGPDAAEYAGEQARRRRLGRVLGSVAQTRRALRLPEVEGVPSLVVAPVMVGDEIVAYLMAEEDVTEAGGEDLTLLVTEHGATICGVILGRERVVAAAAGRVRDDLVEGLLLGRADGPDELLRWAQHLGYDAGHVHLVLCVVLEDPGPDGGAGGEAPAAARRRRIFDSLEHLAGGRAPSAIVATRDREMVVVAREGVAPGQGRLLPARELAGAMLAHAGRMFPDAVLTVGIGGACREPPEIARAYAQARRTIEIGRRIGRQGQAIAFDGLGIHRLLLQVPDLGELRAFADEVLGALGAHDRRHRSGYLGTLATYLRENGSLQRAAGRLHVHPNTVTYRLNRVEEITGLSLGRYRDRLMAQVALEILDALEDSR